MELTGPALCLVLLNFPVGFRLQQLCATLVHEKHRDSRCPSLGALAGFAPHKSLLGSLQLQSWEFGKIHLPLWEITVIMKKKLLSILSAVGISTFQLQKNSNSPTYVKFQHHLVCFVHLIEQSLVINSIDSLSLMFLSWTTSWFYRRSIWDLVNYPLALGNDISRDLKTFNIKCCCSEH